MKVITVTNQKGKVTEDINAFIDEFLEKEN